MGKTTAININNMEETIRTVGNILSQMRNARSMIYAVKQKALITYARNFSGKDKPDTDAEKIIGELNRAKFLKIDEKGNVSYEL
jgi:hypothetical protein